MSARHTNDITVHASHGARGDQAGRRAVVVAGAAAVAATIWGLAHVLGVDVEAPAMGDSRSAPVGLGRTIVTASVASLAGWGLLAALEHRWPSRAAGAWTATAVVVLLVSLGAPLTGEAITTSTRLALASLHVGVAAVLIAGLVGAPLRRRRD